MGDNLQQVSDPTPNAQLLAALYPSSSANNTSKNFNQQMFAQQGGTTGGINSESSFSSGAAASQQGVSPAWLQNGSQNDVPTSSSSNSTTGSNSPLAAPTVGSTAGQGTSTLGQITAQNQSLLNSGGSNSGTNGKAPSSGSSDGFGGLANQAGSFLGKQLGIGNGITSAINNFGETLGFGSAGGANEAISPALAAADPSLANPVLAGAGNVGSVTGASLGSVLGAASAGFIGGGFLAGALGENKLGGSIGGGIGAAAGEAFGGAAAAELGMELGSFAGPIGAIVGGAAGALLGGAFGNTTPATQRSGFDSELLSDGHINNNGEESSKGLSGAVGKSIETQLSTLFSSASSSLGFKFPSTTEKDADGTFHDIGIDGGINTLYSGDKSKPGYIDIGTGSGSANITRFNFDPNNNQSVATAYYGALSDAAQAAGYTNTQALHDWFYGSPNASHNVNFAGPSINPQGSSNQGLTPVA